MAAGVMLTDHLTQMVSVCNVWVVRGGYTTGGPSSVYWQL